MLCMCMVGANEKLRRMLEVGFFKKSEILETLSTLERSVAP